MLQMMLRSALFHGIAEPALTDISAFSELMVFGVGAQVIAEGDGRHLDLLLLVDGEITVGTKFSPLPAAMEFNLHAIGNEMLGEVAWILGNKRSATVTCKKVCKFIRIDGDKLFAYCNANPVVGVELMTRVAAVLAQRVIHLTELLRDKALYT